MRTESNKKRGLKILLLILIILFFALIVAGGIYMLVMRGKAEFFAKTLVNGYDVSGMEPKEAEQMLEDLYTRARILINEKGEPAAEGSLDDFGYSVDTEGLTRLLDKAKREQTGGFGALFKSLAGGNAFVLQIPFVVDEEKLAKAASASALKEERVPSRDAYMDYNAEDNSYFIVPEVFGNVFPDEKLKDLVQFRIENYTKERVPAEEIVVDFPEEIYLTPSVTKDDAGLNAQCSVYNSFCKAQITYQFGSQTETLGWDTVKDWITVSGNEGILSDEKIRAFVQDLEYRYNTRYLDRTFHTTYGNDIVIPGGLNEYGYRINEDAEVQQLVTDLYNNTATSREPVYYSVNGDYGNPLYYHREGRDDLAGTYVEVNLSAQHLWFYKNYSLIVESDIVSGSVAKGAETQTGAFPLAYKESPSVLVGTNAADGYQTKVQYWMPFYEGQGLHDATWRGSFGGSIYVNSGSHGCVNLPYWAAEQIYNNIDAGVAIIIFK